MSEQSRRGSRSAQLPGWALLLAVSALVMGCSAPSDGQAGADPNAKDDLAADRGYHAMVTLIDEARR